MFKNIKKFILFFTVLCIIHNVSLCYSETFGSAELETTVTESFLQKSEEDVEDNLESICDSANGEEESIESETEESDENAESEENAENVDNFENEDSIENAEGIVNDESTPSEIVEEDTKESVENEEEIVASESDVLLENNAIAMFGAGSNVYWYVKNGGTELHLSGTLPTDPEYVAGHDDYYGSLYPYNAADVTKVIIDNEIHPVSCVQWFQGFTNLTSIENINWFNTSEVTEMCYMFQECENINSLDLSTFDTQNVTDMSFMFYYCTNISDLNLSNFNTEKVTTMAYMFYDCYALTTLDISSFDTSSLTDATTMFSEAGLQKIYASPTFNIAASASSQMFTNCSNLEGENGTRYDVHLVDDGTYARLDTPSTPGYFTRKQLTVSFDTDGGSSIPPYIAYRGYTFTAPTAPTKSGFTFVNWYKEPARTNMWNFASDVVKNNMTLYAKWQVVGGGSGDDDHGGSGGGGGGGGGGGVPQIDPNGNITPSGGIGIGLEGLNGNNIKYCTFYKWDYDGKIAKNSNIRYNLNDYKFYNYDLKVVVNEWVGFSYFGSKIIWYYTKYDGTVNKNAFMNIGRFFYCFDETGKMMTGKKEIDGKTYYFIEGDGPVEGVYVLDQYLKYK